MNTGMQDAFNLSWKLALVIRNLCGEHLLESYSPERSKVGDEVLKQAGRLTDVATVKSSTLQTIRNFVGHIMLGLTAVQHGIANSMSEIAIGYPDSPLNAHSGSGHGEPKPGERAPIRSGESPIGAGATPRFALFTEDSAEARGVIAKYLEILEPSPRKAFADHGVWLVRPDGYVALAAKDSGIRDVDEYLANLSKVAAAEG
jgi:hypothetical protein